MNVPGHIEGCEILSEEVSQYFGLTFAYHLGLDEHKPTFLVSSYKYPDLYTNLEPDI